MPVIYPVAGGKGGIGKSFITANLGWLLARAGKTVLLADLDLGGANLHTIMGIQNPAAGLNNFLDKTAPNLMEAIVPCQIPGLSLLSGKECSLEAANLSYAQKQKIISAIVRLPFDYILLDLGAGTHFNTLDFFLTSNDVILIFTPEPTSIENGVKFIKTVYHRKLKHFLKKQGEIAAVEGDGRLPPFLEMPGLTGAAEKHEDPIMTCLEQISFKFIINQIRDQNVAQMGRALLNLCRRHFHSNFELIGSIDYDERVLDSICSKQMFASRFPRSRTTYSLMEITKSLVSAKKAPGLPRLKPYADRNCYEILDIHPGAPAGEVNRAHQTVCSLYLDNPLIVNSFFSGEEKTRILETIDRAWEVLSDPAGRNEYDCSLIQTKPADSHGTGKTAGTEPDRPLESSPAPDDDKQKTPDNDGLKRQSEKIAAQHTISGQDLKTFRIASGVTIQALFQKTRICGSSLTMIEEEQFESLPPTTYLKGFLKAYANTLGLAPEKIVDGYLRNMDKKKSPPPD